MSVKKRTAKALALLLQTGVLGLSSALAATQAHAETPAELMPGASVADRLSAIRTAVSKANPQVYPGLVSRAQLVLANWLNFGGGMGWRNGGWHNWHNWGNGWHNGGWGNGGWGNGGWGNGWHNGWHNFWHNW
jgi:rSAM-associated Gly-rich repeat protein